jgi:16S rRNA (cytidine1402-2'-O)-methyltransferase
MTAPTRAASPSPAPASQRAQVPATGRLLLVPVPLDFGCASQAPIGDVLPLATLRAAAGLTHWVCENARTLRAALKRVEAVVPLTLPLQQLTIVELPRELHKKGDDGTARGTGLDLRPLLQPALQGQDIGLASEAGMPAVADPGASVVRAAHDLGLAVVPLVGPSSLLLALAASGLNGQQFAFVGYLPQDAQARLQRLRELETIALRTGQAQVFIETPYRNAAMLDALLQGLQPTTRLVVASGLTLPEARVTSLPVKDWKTRRAAGPKDDARDLPAVYAIGR